MQATQNTDTPIPLLRQAALLGPGHHGRRRTAGDSERARLAEAFDGTGQEVPAYLAQPRSWVDRRAKLFEAGEYPDKGVTVTEADLLALEAAFDLPVPILIEHARSPLEIGYLTAVEAKGSELFGTLALAEEADSLIQRDGARALSLGLSPDLSEIREVSLVRRPRVPSARLFADGPSFVGRVEAPDSADAETLDRLTAEGRLAPAQRPFAEALLADSGTVEFDGGVEPVRSLVLRMLGAALPHSLFTESAPVAPTAAGLAPEEADFYRRVFPGLDLGEIARNRT